MGWSVAEATEGLAGRRETEHAGATSHLDLPNMETERGGTDGREKDSRHDGLIIKTLMIPLRPETVSGRRDARAPSSA